MLVEGNRTYYGLDDLNNEARAAAQSASVLAGRGRATKIRWDLSVGNDSRPSLQVYYEAKSPYTNSKGSYFVSVAI